MFSKNVDFIKYVLDFNGIPYEEPFEEIEFNQRVFIPLFKETLLECQKLIDFSKMRKEAEYVLTENSHSIEIGQNVKYIYSVIEKDTGQILKFGFPYAKISSQFLEGKPTVYYFSDADGKIYFNKIADKDYHYIIIFYAFDLEEDPHFILQEAPELLKTGFLAKLMLYVGKIAEWRVFMETFYSLAKIQKGFEKQKEFLTTRINLDWPYSGWW